MENNLDKRAHRVYKDIIQLSAKIYNISEEEFVQNEVLKLYSSEAIQLYENSYDIILPDEIKAMFRYFSYCNGPDLTIFIQYKNDHKGEIVFAEPDQNTDSWEYSLYIPMEDWKSDENFEILQELQDTYDCNVHETFGPVKNTPIFHPKWFYIGCCNPDLSSYLFLDFAPEEGGNIGQVILMECCDRRLNRVISPSLLNFYEDFVIPSLKYYE